MSARQAITLVAWREIHERLRSRVFIWSTVLLLVLVGGSTALSAALQPSTTYRIAVVAPVPSALTASLERAAKPFEAKVKVESVASAAAATALLDKKKADAALLLSRDRIVFQKTVDTQLAAIADAATRAVRRHLPPAPELTAVTVEPPKSATSDAETLVAFLGAAVLLGALAVYGQWVLTGVVEEKASRVVEVIVATVRPRHLMAGKVIGIGLLGLAQMALIGGLTAALLVAGMFDAPASLSASVLMLVPWFGLGFALYAVAYAAVGAMASRTQDANSAGLPVTYTLLAMFYLSYAALSSDAEGRLAQILTVFPLTAPIVLPARSALVGVPLWQHIVAVVLVVAAIYALVRLAGRVYAAGLLRSGPRLKLRAAVHLVRHS
jgi:ABC-2 type transport system permease protein